MEQPFELVWYLGSGICIPSVIPEIIIKFDSDEDRITINMGGLCLPTFGSLKVLLSGR